MRSAITHLRLDAVDVFVTHLDKAAQAHRCRRTAVLRGVEVFDRLGAAFLEDATQSGVETGPPGDAPFEEGEAELGEARGHAAEEECAAGRLTRGREMTELVVDVIFTGDA